MKENHHSNIETDNLTTYEGYMIYMQELEVLVRRKIYRHQDRVD